MKIGFLSKNQRNNCLSVSKKLMNCVKNGTNHKLLMARTKVLHFESKTH